VLRPIDDTLFHQTATTFDHAFTSDHRFYDRYWFQALEPGCGTNVVVGMGLYKNTNALDGFAVVVQDGLQYNRRFSRPLRPLSDVQKVGPLSVEVVEGLKRLRISVERGARPIACDLLWTGRYDAVEEPPMWRRLEGRVQTQLQRFYQLGRVDGWLEIDGKRREVSDWFGQRDHSWGVRPGTGGYEPVTGPTRVPHAEFLRCFLQANTANVAGVFDVTRGGGGYHRSDGMLTWPSGSGRAALRLRRVDIDLAFRPGYSPAETSTVRFDRAALDVVAADGSKWKVDCEVVAPPWVLRGSGYDMGYADGRGLGVHRGDLEEGEVLDITRDDQVFRLPERAPYACLHREHTVNLRINGEPGQGNLTVWRDFTDDVEGHLYEGDSTESGSPV
jgi:hypothetical protein